MKAAVFYAPFDIRIGEVSSPKLQDPSDAIVRVTYACICGSDLWQYRGNMKREKGSRMGHEFMGIVEEVGEDVKRIRPGDVVIAPFDYAGGNCLNCLSGMPSSCMNGGVWGFGSNDGGQGEQVRVPFADNNLFIIPKEKARDKTLAAILSLTDVMCTGYHAAVSAGVKTGDTVTVVGDGAVGLCAVLSCTRLGAKRIIHLSHHKERSQIGQLFGSTEVVSEQDAKAVEVVREKTLGLGVDCVLECVGNRSSWDIALGIVRDGGQVGFVGVPHDVPDVKISDIYKRNFGIRGGRAPVLNYLPDLLPDVLSGNFDPSPIFDKTVEFKDLTGGYEAMHNRQAIKVLVLVG